MRKLLIISLGLFFVLFFAGSAKAEEIVPRIVIALYNGGNIQESYIHTVAEMPLNHLGLVVEYHDIHDPLPDIAQRKDIRGVLTWFMAPMPQDPKTYFDWAANVVASGKKFVVLGSPGIYSGKQVDPSLRNKFLALLGVKLMDQWVDRPFDVQYDYLNPDMFLTNKPYEWLREPYAAAHAISDDVIVHLRTHSQTRPQDDSDLIITGPHGGYASEGYVFRTNLSDGEEVSQWLLNPFEFFRLAYGTDDLPKPDTTTIAGRRMYYSSIDGDGWNNVTEIEEYRGKGILSSQVIMEKAIEPYPDMPVLMAIIGADIDPAWAATKDSREIAKKFLALPQVEAGTHTYSHPFYWQFFEDGNWKKEIPYLPLYKPAAWKPDPEDLKNAPKERPPLPNGYLVPRAFAHEPFDIHKEIEGSIKEVSELLPPGKKVEVLAWPGNCSPWDNVIRMTREAHVQNINGGDSRFDADYPGYASEEPIGKQVGNQRQIYNPTSNEDLYTNQWSENFNAFQYLKTTLKNSETPIRLKPISIYYHIYSGEKEASLKALISNIEYARQQNIIPMKVSEYTHIAEAYYDATITQLASGMWRIDNRGSLQTVRFDHHTLQSVDFARSKGVIGQRYHQGSLYVYLDAAVSQPIIAIKDNSDYSEPPKENEPYLVESHWEISNLHRRQNSIDFTAHGFGSGDMIWRMPSSGTYEISVNGNSQSIVAQDGLLILKLDPANQAVVHVTIKGT